MLTSSLFCGKKQKVSKSVEDQTALPFFDIISVLFAQHSCNMKQVLLPLIRICLGLFTFAFLPFASEIVNAQVTADDTVNTQVDKTDNVSEITGGETRGDNLFHSFQEFSVGTGETASFLNSNDIANIFSRVTGGNVSSIDGLIRANGSANLFLINPAGIIFGEGASLNIGGSFYGSTADSILFKDGEFSATDLENPPVLTINAPIGLGFRDNPQDIINQSRALDSSGKFASGLQVLEGKNLALIGGDVRFDGGAITAPGGRVELGGLSKAGKVGFNNDGSFSFSEDVAKSDVSLSKNAFVDVSSNGRGSIQVNTNNFELSSGSIFNAGISANSGSKDAQAGDIIINATNAITLNQKSYIFNQVAENAVGNAGDVEINANILDITDGALISSSTFGTGNAGNITVNANDSVSFEGTDSEGFPSAAFSNVEAGGVGKGGEIKITAGSLSLLNGGQLNAFVRDKSETASGGIGDAGKVKLNIRYATTIAGVNKNEARSGITSYIGIGAKGNAGEIDITTGNLTVTDGAQIASSTFGTGNAGKITVNANNTISFEGTDNQGKPSAAFSNVDVGSKGNAGGIDLTTGNLAVIDGAQIASSTFGKGNAGDITINANDTVTFKGTDSQENSSGAFSNVDAGGEGEGGEIKITAGSLSLLNGGQLNAFVVAKSETASGGKGDAGKVILNIRDATTIAGVNEDGNRSGIFSDVLRGGKGNAGGVDITTDNLTVTDGAQLVSSTFGTGNAGNITVNANDIVIFKGTDSEGEPSGAFSNVGAGGEGDGGEIKITAGSLSLLNGGQLNAFVGAESETASGGKGNAGKVTLNVSDKATIAGVNKNGTRSGISNSVETGGKGNAGGIELNVDNLAVTDGAQIASSTFGAGNAGNITVNANDTVSFEGTDSEGEPSAVFSNVDAGGKGDGGEIKITARSLSLLNGGQLNAIVLAKSETASGGKGDAGKVTLNISDEANIAGVNKNGTRSGIFSSVGTEAKGNAGGIDITTSNLKVTDGAGLDSSTFGAGNAGNININASDNVSFKGTDSEGEPSVASSNVEAGGIGFTGNINIKANSISLTSGAQLQSGVVQNLDDFTQSGISLGGGNIRLNAEENITLSGRNQDGTTSGIFTGVEELVLIGSAGNIEIDASFLSLTDGAQLNTQFTGLVGNTGNITVGVDSLTLDNNSSITSSITPSEAFPGYFKKAAIEAFSKDYPELSPGSQKGGNVTINFQNVLKLSGGSVIDAKATGESSGGNITINSSEGVIVAYPDQNNDITANAEQGSGGKINIDAESVLGIEERTLNDRTNDINASSDVLGLDGTVNLNTSDINPIQGATELPSNIVETRQTSEQTCSVDRRTGTASGLTVTGRGGVHPAPDLPLTSQSIMDNGKKAVTESQARAIAPVHTSKGDIIPAQGIIVTEDGRMVLTAYPTDGNSRVPQGSVNCTR
jgi:filamentous hemagglutinin family protein